MASQVESAKLDDAEIRRSTGIVLPQLPANWQVRDVQLFPTADSPAIAIALTTEKGEQLSLFADRAETPAEGQPLIAERRDGTVAYWEAGDMAYALTGKADTPRLMALAERIAPAA